ncbi:hypothetical protein BT96DRAFT_947315 [Gymnopus androsaceus JB14]|uniref:Uncharacterized protein n=1 Tax=Gymnopus androsaceus JB14 TaxID=1447944 RepID=A0A6A4GT26_9AGAR|nr:hypothetical protein BT96DRAFT_947315 [Gymnopus androsaceus JB14]
MSGFQSSLLKPKVQLEAIPPWERKQCPIPGYDLEAIEAMWAESSPTPTLIKLDEEDIPLDLEQRGIKYVAFASRKRLSFYIGPFYRTLQARSPAYIVYQTLRSGTSCTTYAYDWAAVRAAFARAVSQKRESSRKINTS